MRHGSTVRRATWIGAGVAAALLGASTACAAAPRRPVVFEANHGQVDSQVKFLSRGSGYTLFITAAETILADHRSGARVRLRLAGARQDPEVVGLEALPGQSHYFIGRDPARWRTNVPTYAGVAYQDVYPGIDAVYRAASGRRIEQDFLVKPGADPDAIRLEFTGIGAVTIDAAGDLMLAGESGDVRLSRPVAYQDIDGARREVPAAWVVQGPREAGFRVGPYDRSALLVIDPIILWATYLGGSGNDLAFGVALDRAGSTLVTGETSSIDFPTTGTSALAGGTDVFVTKLDSLSNFLFYSAYIGGSGSEGGRAIAVDGNGSAYLAGFTGSPDFPTTVGALQPGPGGDLDGFVVKLDATGALIYATYLGGADADAVLGLAVDAEGRAHVAGGTRSSDFPIADALQPAPGGGTCGIAPDVFPCRDAFVARLNPQGTELEYSSFLGGSNDDAANGIAMDDSGRAYLTGFTTSADFPTTAGSVQPGPRGGLDAFVARVDANGSLGWATYLGGSGSDTASSIAVDRAGRSHVVGSTSSNDFPATEGDSFSGVTEGFAVKLDTAGTSIGWSRRTSRPEAVPTAVALDNRGDVYLVANDFICTLFTPSFPPVCSQLHVDVVVEKRGPDRGESLFVESFGGRANGFDGQDFGEAIAARNGLVWVVGHTVARNLPTTPGAFQATHRGGTFDAFVVRLGDPIVIRDVNVQAPSFFDGSAAGGGCLIATAAFGSPLAPEVRTLREFRDRALLIHPAGRALVRAYYWLSPPLARTVAREPGLAAAVRAVLRPIAGGAGFALDRPVTAIGLGAAMLAAFVTVFVSAARRRRRIRGVALVVMGAVLLASALALVGEPHRSFPSPAPAAQPEPDVSDTPVAAVAPEPRAAARPPAQASRPARPVAQVVPAPTPSSLLDLSAVGDGAASVRLLNPFAPHTARRWAVTSDVIEGVLGPEGFVVTDSRLAGDLGIEAGDTIVRIGAHPPRGLLTVMSAVQRDPDRATVLVEIDRGGTRLVYSYRVR